MGPERVSVSEVFAGVEMALRITGRARSRRGGVVTVLSLEQRHSELLRMTYGSINGLELDVASKGDRSRPRFGC